LSHVDARLHPERTYLYGPNGSGKTSFLEALYVLSRGRSFRTRHSRKLIQEGASELSVFGESLDTSGLRRVGVEMSADGLRIKIDQEAAPGMAELATVLRADVIDPSVHRLIEGGPSERRRFLDWGVFHVEHAFLAVWRRYRRVLGQRNASLKSGMSGAALTVWDRVFVEAAADVDTARAAYVERLAPLVTHAGRVLLNGDLEVEYVRGWRRGTSLDEALAAGRDRDERLGFTQAGPHRADLALRLDGASLEERASRGQQKLAAAALVVAQVRALSATEGTGLLLVDDPAAELDRRALERLLELLAETPVQLVFTALAETQLPPEARFPVFHVEQGRVQEMVQ
jgi:DNA replication and repair protein RecF